MANQKTLTRTTGKFKVTANTSGKSTRSKATVGAKLKTGAKAKASRAKPGTKNGSSKSTGGSASATMGPRKVRPGFISHTELASANPAATKAWCSTVLGWKFMAPMPIPGGEYHMWSFGNNTGGGLRANNPPEVPGSIPYVEVPDIKAAWAKALKGGAVEMMAPDQIPGTTDWIAIVKAPGGVAFGFWAPK